MIALLLDHLWQSSLCVGGAGLIVLALSDNGAKVRFWVWFAASLKFLVPFAALTALAAYALAPMVPPKALPKVTFIEPLAKPFSSYPAVRVATKPLASAAHPVLPANQAWPKASAPLAPFDLPTVPPSHLDRELALLALWAAGFLVLATRWLVRWSRIRALVRDAAGARVDGPVAVKFSASRLEPGLVGIWHPVILLPRGVEQQLSPSELRAVLAHELSHWRRHDNLLSAIHMLVEALFWFFPLVWWLGARLNAERERACDESVLADGNDPRAYAEGILKVCRAYLQSPLACVAGVSGASLKKRIEAIMENRLTVQLNAARKLVLSASAAAALVLPLALGLMASPVAQMQAQASIFLPARNAQSGVEDALKAETSPAALPKNQVAEIPAKPVRQTSKAAGSSAKTPAPTAVARLLAPRHVGVPSPDSSQPLPAKSQLVATNDPQIAPEGIASNFSSAAAAAPNAQAAAPIAPAPAIEAVSGRTITQESAMLKQTFSTLIALVGLSGAAVAQTCTLPKIVDTAMLEQVPGTDLMTVPVEIKGAPKHFLLDIGTDPTEVSAATVAQLGLPETYKRGETIGGGRTNMSQPMGNDLAALTNGGLGNVSVYDVRDRSGRGALETRVRIPSFTIGGATAHNMIFLVANDAEMGRSSSEPYDGLLTGDFFKQYDVELDFAGKQINWLTPTKCTDPGQVVFWPHGAVGVVPMTMVDGKMQVPVLAGGHPLNAVIDTSSSRTVMRRDVAELLFGLKAGAPDMMPAGDLKDGQGQQVYVHTFPQITFAGGVTANNVPVLIQTNSLTHEINSEKVLGSWARSADARIPDLALGMDVLHQLHMYVVPGQGKVYVTSAMPASE